MAFREVLVLREIEELSQKEIARSQRADNNVSLARARPGEELETRAEKGGLTWTAEIDRICSGIVDGRLNFRRTLEVEAHRRLSAQILPEVIVKICKERYNVRAVLPRPAWKEKPELLPREIAASSLRGSSDGRGLEAERRLQQPHCCSSLWWGVRRVLQRTRK